MSAALRASVSPDELSRGRDDLALAAGGLTVRRARRRPAVHSSSANSTRPSAGSAELTRTRTA
jgi:hypothetical protein